MTRSSRFVATVAAALGLVPAALGSAHAAGDDATVRACIEDAERGQAVRNAGDYTRAREMFARCAAPTCPSLVQQDCATWAQELDRDMPRLVVRVEDTSGHLLDDATLTINDAPVARTPDEIRVNPGPLRIRAEKPGVGVAEEKITAYPRDFLRVALKIDTRPLLAAQPSFAPPSRVPFYASAIVAGGALVTFGAFETRAQTHFADLKSTCSPHCADDDLSAVRREFVVSRISLGVFGVASVATLAAWIFSRPSEAPGATPR